MFNHKQCVSVPRITVLFNIMLLKYNNYVDGMLFANLCLVTQ